MDIETIIVAMIKKGEHEYTSYYRLVLMISNVIPKGSHSLL